MVNKDGKAESDRMSIANIFADFYEQLYALRRESHIIAPYDDDSENIDPFTRDEVVKSIKDLNSNRCADSKGVKAEMLKYGGPKLVDVLLEMFNKILMEKSEPPTAWKLSGSVANSSTTDSSSNQTLGSSNAGGVGGRSGSL